MRSLLAWPCRLSKLGYCSFKPCRLRPPLSGHRRPRRPYFSPASRRLYGKLVDKYVRLLAAPQDRHLHSVRQFSYPICAYGDLSTSRAAFYSAQQAQLDHLKNPERSPSDGAHFTHGSYGPYIRLQR